MTALVILIVAVAVFFTLRRFFPGRASAPAAAVRGGSANAAAGAVEKSSENDFVEAANAASRASRRNSAAALGSPLK